MYAFLFLPPENKFSLPLGSEQIDAVCAAALSMSAVLTISWSGFENVSPVLPGVSVSAGRVPVVFQEEKTPTRSPCSPSAGLSSLPPPGERDGGLGHGPPGHQTQADIYNISGLLTKDDLI